MRGIALLALLAIPLSANACEPSDIDIESVKLGVTDTCRTRSCPRVKGVVTVVNRCESATGIELHVTGNDASGAAVWVGQFWPNSVSNVPTGRSALGVDTDGKGASSVKSFTVRVSRVKQWRG